jgi:hypothetical protein
MPAKLTQAIFIERGTNVHLNKYDHSLVVYVNADTKVHIICPLHGGFFQTAWCHLKGQGCPDCSPDKRRATMMQRYGVAQSQQSPIFREKTKQTNLKKYGTEYSFVAKEVKTKYTKTMIERYGVPHTKFRADGYCVATNTIYEFHGDRWHGNPVLFQADVLCHPKTNKSTAGELYKKTIDREQRIKDLGFNLVVMWEHDYT